MILAYVIIGFILDIAVYATVEIVSKGKYVYHGDIFLILSILIYMFK